MKTKAAKLRSLAAAIGREIKSGDYDRADAAVRQVVEANDPALFSMLLGDTYVDCRGILWVTRRFVVAPPKQQVVDYAFWELLALAPEEVFTNGFHRNQIDTICFRAYGPGIFSPDLYEPYYHGRGGNTVHQLLRFPAAVTRFPGLKELNACWTAFQSLPDSIGGMQELRILKIWGGRFKTVPDTLANLTGLKVLEVCSCNLGFVPESIRALTSLHRLSLNGNRLQSLPDWLAELPVLKYLSADYNLLTALPAWLTRCRSLRSLELSHNHIGELPEEFGAMASLEHIELTGNLKLRQIHPKAQVPENLRQLVLQGCPLTGGGGNPEILGSREKIFALFSRKSGDGKPAEIKPAVAEIIVPEHGLMKIVRPMLESGKSEHFHAGMRLLEGARDEQFTEAAFSVLAAVLPKMREAPRRELMGHLTEYLARSGFPSRSDASGYRASVRTLELSIDPESIPEVFRAWPSLEGLDISFLTAAGSLQTELLPEVLRDEGFTRINNLKLQDVKCLEIGFGHTLKACTNFILESCTIIRGLRFIGCPALETFHFSASWFRELEFRNCPELRKIYRSVLFKKTRRQDRRTDVIISGCPRLTSIELSGLHIGNIDISDCPGLESISISGLLSRPDRIRITGCPSLKTISLKDCGLKEIPAFIFGMTGVTSLDLSDNRLVHVDNLGGLTSLEQLRIGGNRLIRVPEELPGLPALRSVNFGWQTTPGAGNSTLRKLGRLHESPQLISINIILPEKTIRRMAGDFRRNRVCFSSEFSRE